MPTCLFFSLYSSDKLLHQNLPAVLDDNTLVFAANLLALQIVKAVGLAIGYCFTVIVYCLTDSRRFVYLLNGLGNLQFIDNVVVQDVRVVDSRDVKVLAIKLGLRIDAGSNAELA